jgi:hypothetical protein
MAPPYVTPLKKWLEKLVHTRFLTWMSPCVWGSADGYGSTRGWLHGTSVGRMLVNAFWKILGQDVIDLNKYDKHPETAKLKPWSNPMFIGSGLSILNYDSDFFELVRSGKIKVHIGDIEKVESSSVVLSNGERLTVDTVVCSTGWKCRPPLKFLGVNDEELGLPHHSEKPDPLDEVADAQIFRSFPRLQEPYNPNPRFTEPPTAPSDVTAPPRLNVPWRLYRFMVPPADTEDRSIAFAGVPMTITNSIFATVQALWISAYFDRQLDLETSVQPPPGKSDVDAITWETHLFARFGKWRYPAGHGALHPDFVFDAVPYLDLLLKQLGLKAHRKGSALKEIFDPYGPEDYRGLVGEWSKK